MLIASKGRQHWKLIAREMDLSESQINEIDYNNTNETNDLQQRLYDTINCWINNNGHANATINKTTRYSKSIEIECIKRRDSI